LQGFLRLDDENTIRDILVPMSLGQFNEKIEQSLTDEKEGRWTRVEDLKRKIEKWGSNV